MWAWLYRAMMCVHFQALHTACSGRMLWGASAVHCSITGSAAATEWHACKDRHYKHKGERNRLSRGIHNWVSQCTMYRVHTTPERRSKGTGQSGSQCETHCDIGGYTSKHGADGMPPWTQGLAGVGVIRQRKKMTGTITSCNVVLVHRDCLVLVFHGQAAIEGGGLACNLLSYTTTPMQDHTCQLNMHADSWRPRLSVDTAHKTRQTV